MGLTQVLVLAVLQGLTEFLPISSSAHLILLPSLVQWPDQGLGFDLAVHLGTLTAVVLYFRRDLVVMGCDWVHSVRKRQLTGDSRLAWAVLLGTIPVGLSGLLMESLVETQLRSPLVITITTIGFGLLLWLAATRYDGKRSEHALHWWDVFIIGCAQAIALIPGTSRSGITITAGLMCGLSREGAARFSFLLAIPVTTLAGGLKMIQLANGGENIDWLALGIGVIISAITALLCIHFFLSLLGRLGLMPYVVYRLGLGALLIGIYYL